jgi:hypothetical protein
MADSKRGERLVRESEPSQRTEKGFEIPIPERERFFEDRDKASRKNSGPEKPSRSDLRKP